MKKKVQPHGMQLQSKLVDAKPRSAQRPRKRGPRHATRAGERRGVMMRTIAQASGLVQLADRTPRGDRSGVVLGVTGYQGGISSNPVNILARRIRGALSAPPAPDILVYDGAGNLLRRLDGYTRQEKPL